MLRADTVNVYGVALLIVQTPRALNLPAVIVRPRQLHVHGNDDGVPWTVLTIVVTMSPWRYGSLAGGVILAVLPFELVLDAQRAAGHRQQRSRNGRRS